MSERYGGGAFDVYDTYSRNFVYEKEHTPLSITKRAIVLSREIEHFPNKPVTQHLKNSTTKARETILAAKFSATEQTPLSFLSCISRNHLTQLHRTSEKHTGLFHTPYQLPLWNLLFTSEKWGKMLR